MADIIYPPTGFLIDSIFINNHYYTNVQDSLGGKIIKNIDSIFRSPVISIKYKRQIIIAHYLQSTPVIDTYIIVWWIQTDIVYPPMPLLII